MRNFLLGALIVALVAVVAFYFYRENNFVIEKPSLPSATQSR